MIDCFQLFQLILIYFWLCFRTCIVFLCLLYA